MVHMSDADAKRLTCLITLRNCRCRKPIWNVAVFDLRYECQVALIWRFLRPFTADRVVDEYRNLFGLSDCLVDNLVELCAPCTIHFALRKICLAMRTGEFILHRTGLLIYRCFPENDLAGAFRAYKNIRPDRVVDLALGLAIRM